MKLFKLMPLILSAFALPVMAAGFNGAYDPSQWAVSNVGTLIGGSPTLGTATFGPTSLSLVGSDSISPDPANLATGCTNGVYGEISSPCQVQATIGLAGSYTFSWSYLTSDGDGPPGDVFGVIVDGTRIAISDQGGANQQGGTSTFAAMSSFGFFMNCTDCIGGSASTTVSDFAVVTTPIPEPSTYALMLAGVAGIGAWRRATRKA